jgi:hypothetical protein
MWVPLLSEKEIVSEKRWVNGEIGCAPLSKYSQVLIGVKGSHSALVFLVVTNYAVQNPLSFCVTLRNLNLYLVIYLSE